MQQWTSKQGELEIECIESNRIRELNLEARLEWDSQVTNGVIDASNIFDQRKKRSLGFIICIGLLLLLLLFACWLFLFG